MTFPSSGTPGNPIIIRGNGDSTAEFDSCANDCIDISNKTNITIIDLKITDATGNAIYRADDAESWADLDTANIIIENCDISGSSQSGIKIKGDAVTIRYNTLDDNGAAGTPAYHNIYYTGDDNIIEKNSLTNSDVHGVRGYGDVIIRYNYFSGNAQDAINLFDEAGGEVHSAVKIYYNLILSSAGTGEYFIGLDSSTEEDIWDAPEIINNTMYNTTSGSDGILFDNTTDVVVKNNIIQVEDIALGFIDAAADDNADIAYNLYYNVDQYYTSTGVKTWAQWIALGYDDDGSIEDDNPDFTTPGSNFTLLSGSPAINVGDSTLGATYDDALHSTSTWPDGVVTLNQDDYGLWEIGAYVYFTPALPIQGAAGNFKLN